MLMMMMMMAVYEFSCSEEDNSSVSPDLLDFYVVDNKTGTE